MDFGIRPVASFEAIDYQGKYSKLAIELTDLFQSVIDYRGTLTGKQKEIAMNVRSFVDSKNFLKELKDIVYTHTGMEYNVRLKYGSLSNFFSTSWAMDEAFTEYGTSHKASTTDPISFEKKLDIFRKSFDTKQGVFSKTPNTARYIILNYGKLVFCIDSAFLADMYHVDAKLMTADEIAAIVMHEIGHIISMAERVGLIYRSVTKLTAPITINIASIKEAKKAISNMKDVTKSTKVVSSDKKILNSLDLADKVLTNIDKATDDNSIKHRFSFGFFGVAIFVLYLVWWECICILLNTNTQNISSKKSNTKQSDFMYTISDVEDIEFASDEFVSMHGLGLSLVSALDKIYLNSSISNNEALTNKQKTTLTQLHITLARQYISALVIIRAPNGYGTYKQRNDNIGKSLLKTLRAADLPEQVESDLLKQYRAFKELSAKIEADSAKNYNKAANWQRVLKKIMTLNGLVHFLMNGKADEDYVAIMRDANDLSNTELVYHHKRLSEYV